MRASWDLPNSLVSAGIGSTLSSALAVDFTPAASSSVRGDISASFVADIPFLALAFAFLV